MMKHVTREQVGGSGCPPEPIDRPSDVVGIRRNTLQKNDLAQCNFGTAKRPPVLYF
jgi:hypothetical protein